MPQSVRSMPAASWWGNIRLYALALWRAYWEEDLTDQARSLVYITLLALVPSLAVAFALLSGFGVQGVIEPWLENLFAPMGAAGAQVVEHLIRFVNQTQAGSLGALGVVFLFVSVMALAQKIEAGLNKIWSVDSERPLAVRLAAYTSIVLLAPLLTAAFMSTVFNLQNAGWVQQYAHLPWVSAGLKLLGGVIPAGLAFFTLAALYLWVPNCRVRWWPAVCGAAFFLLLLFPVSWVFSRFIATSSNYSIIYSGFASVVIMLLWLNYLWLLFLLGAKASLLVQRPQERLQHSGQTWQGDEAFATAVALMTAIFAAFRHGEAAMNAEELAGHVQTTPRKASLLLKRLHKAGLLAKTDNKPPRYLPDRAIKYYTLLDIYRALAPQDAPLRQPDGSLYPALRGIYMETLDTAAFREK